MRDTVERQGCCVSDTSESSDDVSDTSESSDEKSDILVNTLRSNTTYSSREETAERNVQSALTSVMSKNWNVRSEWILL